MALVEKVARRICESTDGPWEFHNEDGHAASECQARAAIAEVFDWLAEPGQGAAEAGADALLEHGLDIFFDGRDAKACWTAMLTAKRKEAFGE